MTPKLCVHPVTPISTRRGCAFASFKDGSSGVIETDFPEYPPSPRGEQLRRERVAAGLYLGELARKLGVGVAELSGLERGRNDTDENGWREVFAAIERVTPKKGTP